MRLGISSYTYVWAVGVPGYVPPKQTLTAAGLLAKAAELGVSVVQIADNLPLDRMPSVEIDELAAMARDYELQLEVGTCGGEPDHLRAYLNLAVQLRSPLVRVVIDTDVYHPSPNEVVASLQEVLPEFAAANVRLAIENHDRFPAGTLADILERCASPYLGICLDTANSLGCGEDVHSVVNVLRPHIINAHIKDFCVSRLPHKKGFLVEGCPAGHGVLEIPALIADLRMLQLELSVILELWPSPEATIERSIAKEEAWATESIYYLRQFIPD
jgi:sugar phosphate isomerase/epimerase